MGPAQDPRTVGLVHDFRQLSGECEQAHLVPGAPQPAECGVGRDMPGQTGGPGEM